MVDQGNRSSPSIDAIIPGSITDFAKALREIIKAMRDTAQLCSDAAEFLPFQRRKDRKAAENLSKLAFDPTGVRHQLELIATGGCSPDVQWELITKLSKNVDLIDDAIHGLSSYRSQIREKYGLELVLEFDKLTGRDEGAKAQMRKRIREIAYAKDALQEHRNAEAALREIDNLNKKLCSIHDKILNIKKQNKSKKILAISQSLWRIVLEIRSRGWGTSSCRLTRRP
jgi:hypothetical protein